MNRAMFSGVAGMKAHQTKMDVIGNNIANVNTYGYKAQRAVFSDIYYQTLRGASSGSSSRGGINPSSVGYGSTLNAIQTQMTQSSMQNTGFGMDVAITGEGFLQVMDPDGNIFYTKAGMLDYDANGYLTDINGNFVLGATSVDGKPNTQKIKLDNIGSVAAKQPADTQEINGVHYTVTASNASKYGNVSFTLNSSEALPAGQKAAATISTNGGVTVQLNAKEKFSSMAELNSEINAAIIQANGGKQLAAGTFTITADQNLFGTAGIDGGFQGQAKTDKAGVALNTDFFAGLEVKNFSLSKSPTEDALSRFSVTYAADTHKYTMSGTVNGVLYSAAFDGNVSGEIQLKSAAGTAPDAYPAGYITVDIKDKTRFNTVLTQASTPDGGGAYQPVTSGDFKTVGPHNFLGGACVSSVSSNFSAGGPMQFTCTKEGDNFKITAKVAGKEYTGTVPVASGGTVVLKTAGDESLNGNITMQIPSLANMLASFGLPSNTSADDADFSRLLSGSAAYHTYEGIAAKSGKSEPLTGAEIAGGDFGVTGGSISGTGADMMFGGLMSFQKTSNDFAGSATGISDLKAAYGEDADGGYWEIALNIGGIAYSTKISENTDAASVLLKSANGDYIQVTNPSFASLNELYEARENNPAGAGAVLNGLIDGKSLDITPAQPSKDLGLGTTSFALVGGTEGGAITLDQLASISIGSDGTITVNHAEKGTVAAGKISLASFSNPAGLQLVGNNYYITTANSGEPKLSDPGSSGTGALKSSALEMSNVDLSSEFADMITTQRGFQANSRVITVSDTMLEELINLKR